MSYEGTKIHIEVPNILSIPGTIKGKTQGKYLVLLEVDPENQKYMKEDPYSNELNLGQGEFKEGEHVQVYIDDPMLKPMDGETQFLVSGKITKKNEDGTYDINYIPYTYFNNSENTSKTISVEKKNIQQEFVKPGMSIIIFMKDRERTQLTNVVHGEIKKIYCDRTALVDIHRYNGNSVTDTFSSRMNYEQFYVLTSTHDSIVEQPCTTSLMEVSPMQQVAEMSAQKAKKKAAEVQAAQEKAPQVQVAQDKAPQVQAAQETTRPKQSFRNRFWNFITRKKGGKRKKSTKFRRRFFVKKY
jgi:hypothetical protein